MTIYHVCENWDGGKLLSLAARLGESEAITAYAERWPEAGDLALAHVHLIHFYDAIDDAKEHAEAFGGTVLEIDDGMVDVRRDTLEFDHPTAYGPVPVAAIREVRW